MLLLLLCIEVLLEGEGDHHAVKLDLLVVSFDKVLGHLRGLKLQECPALQHSPEALLHAALRSECGLPPLENGLATGSNPDAQHLGTAKDLVGEEFFEGRHPDRRRDRLDHHGPGVDLSAHPPVLLRRQVDHPAHPFSALAQPQRLGALQGLRDGLHHILGNLVLDLQRVAIGQDDLVVMVDALAQL